MGDRERTRGPEAVRRPPPGVRGQHPDPQRRPQGRGPGGRVHLGGYWVYGDVEQRRESGRKTKSRGQGEEERREVRRHPRLLEGEVRLLEVLPRLLVLLRPAVHGPGRERARP